MRISIIERLKWFLFEEIPHCPECGEKMLKVGYPSGNLQKFKCPNGCYRT